MLSRFLKFAMTSTPIVGNSQRCLSICNSKLIPVDSNNSSSSKTQTREFLDVFPDLVRSFSTEGELAGQPDASKWVEKVLHYNVLGGKNSRGLLLVSSFKTLQTSKTISAEDVRLANVMGWCVEMSYILMQDDIMDNSLTRRGGECWYRKEDVGLTAINDAAFVQSAMYTILHKHFHDKPYYTSAVNMFNEMLLQTTLGQYLDLSAEKTKRSDLSKFTMALYEAVVQYKTSFYTFQVPVGLAMLMSDIHDPEIHRQGNKVLLELGRFRQIEDDFLDCFGDPKVTGKVGSDIQSGKCSWLAVVALQRANSAQKKIMEDYYGSSEPAAVERIKALYTELNLPSTYAIYEKESFNGTKTYIQSIPRGIVHSMLLDISQKVYKRNF